jgi:hypothetical protein
METTKILFAIASLLGLCAVLIYWKLKQKPIQETTYKRRRPMGPAEQAMYWRLTKALPEHIVLPKVALSRCVGVKGPYYDSLSREWLDFVVCDKGMNIIAAIELEHQMESTEGRVIAAKRKAEALTAVEIKLLTWSTHPLPTEAFIAMEFEKPVTSMTKIAA